MASDPVIASPDMTLLHVVNEVFLRRWLTFLPVVENGILLGAIDGHLVAGIDREFWDSTRVDDIFIAPDAHSVLSAKTPITTVLDLIQRTGQRKFLVAAGSQLVGVVTLADLNHRWAQAGMHNRRTRSH